MEIDLSFWRFVIIVHLAKSGLWGKDEDTYLFHIGTFKSEGNTALKVIVLPVCLMVGFV